MWWGVVYNLVVGGVEMWKCMLNRERKNINKKIGKNLSLFDKICRATTLIQVPSWYTNTLSECHITNYIKGLCVPGTFVPSNI